jgi:platelet-activating factor acetylhydrolase
MAMDAWMWPLKDEIELAKSVEQPLLFINMEAFQTAPNLKAMKRFTVDADHTERRVVTLKCVLLLLSIDDSFQMLDLHVRPLSLLAISFRIIGEASTKTKSTYHFYCRCTSGD